jgi:pimeloyl-ACP methyl ester carboxylesterase
MNEKKFNMTKKPFYLLLTLILMASGFGVRAQAKKDRPIHNVVLVHGAFLDGSGWEAVYHILSDKGYKVTVTQHSLRDFDDDVATVEKAIDGQDGPCILVGHSYGGVIITAAGNNPKVAGLVYIAAHAPDAGEHRADLVKKYPSAYKSLIKGDDGDDYLAPAKFAADFAADLPLAKANFLANSQVHTADKVFGAVVTKPAWKYKPSWYMVAADDRIINPDLERFYAKRAQAKTVVEIKGGSHSIFASRPKEVAKLIIEATNQL